MFGRCRALLACAWLISVVPAAARTMTPIEYPETHRDAVVETLFGEPIADPYRWLETTFATIRKSPTGWRARMR